MSSPNLDLVIDPAVLADHGRNFAEFAAAHMSAPNVNLALISFDVSNELGDRLGAEGRVHLQHADPPIDAGDRNNIARDVKIELVVERLVYRIC